jgi:hypothetical protein
MPIIALGITGHRFLPDMDAIMVGVENAFQRILETFPGSDFRVLSSLAEGTDRILAKRFLLIPNTSLWVPLPLPETEYLQDFETTQSKQEFLMLLGKAEKVFTLPVTSTREDAYLAAGKYILEHCDLLMTIWDGKPGRGAAGTSAIIALARKRGLPMAWIHADDRNSGEEKVTFENLPGYGARA